MQTSDLPLVPPSRLAVLLAEKRRESGLDLAALSRRSDQRFSPGMLEKFEKGQAPLTEATLRDLVWLYGLKSEVSLPSRSKLILDLEARHIAVGDTAIPFDGSTADVVLERYVSLLYLLRNERPGRVLSLRDDDLDVLGSTLGLPLSDLTGQLGAIMGAASTRQRTSRLSRNLTLGAAGLLVGITAVGSLIIVGAPDDVQPVATGASDGPHRIERGGSGGGGGGDRAPVNASLLNTVVSPAAAPASSELQNDTLRAIVVANLDAQSSAIEQTSTVEQASAVEQASTVEQASADVAPVSEEQTSYAAIDLAAIESHLGRDLTALVPNWTIHIRGDMVGYRGLTNSAERTITVFLDPGATVGSVAEVLAHEIGHAIDIDRLDTAARMQWVEMRGIPNVWWAGDGLNDFSVGAGDFAEGVAAHLLGSPSQSVYGGFSADQLAFVASVVG